MSFSIEAVEGVGDVLKDPNNSLAERFRALFTLKGIGTPEAIDQICANFSDPSALLKHELAYCLGQIQSPRALPTLMKVLEDREEDPMVRHEAGEAIAAIGEPTGTRDLLRKFVNDPAKEVAETCQLALAKLNWLDGHESCLFKDNNPYQSVDPAPPYRKGGLAEWREEFNDTSKPLFCRYRALFSLRNLGGAEAVDAIVSGFRDSSILFKHEVAYVLGQMQDPGAIPGLVERLEDLEEGAMVRHECAEALGSLASQQCLEVLQHFLGDGQRVVRESCEVALDMCRFERGEEFQYANTVSKVVGELK